MLSQTAEYALRTVLYLADRREDRLVGAYELAKVLGRVPGYAGRKASASTASGLTNVHLTEQAELIDAALAV